MQKFCKGGGELGVFKKEGAHPAYLSGFVQKHWN